jgi:hypothetical protein
MDQNVPVLLIIFNRPEKTRLVVDALRKVRPNRLFIAADGPRTNHPEDQEKCCNARKIATDIDWPCNIKTKFQTENIGCDPNVASAIGWFFEQVEYGLIIEDDCIPHPHLFTFCGELFERYADDERIMQISGFSPYKSRKHDYDYHFSRAFRCWGWGTWRRAWNHFTPSVEQFTYEDAYQILKGYYPSNAALKPRNTQFYQFKQGQLNNWDFQWNMACFSQNGLCIVPEKNLIKNIGFGNDATHTIKRNSIFAGFEVHSIKFPLCHPPYIFADTRPEQCLEKSIHRKLPLKTRLGRHLRHFLGAVTDFYETRP